MHMRQQVTDLTVKGQYVLVIISVETSKPLFGQGTFVSLLLLSRNSCIILLRSKKHTLEINFGHVSKRPCHILCCAQNVNTQFCYFGVDFEFLFFKKNDKASLVIVISFENCSFSSYL